MAFIYAAIFIWVIRWSLKRELRNRREYFVEKEKQPKVRIRL